MPGRGGSTKKGGARGGSRKRKAATETEQSPPPETIREEPMTGGDDDATCAMDNSSTSTFQRTYCSFLNVRVSVPESKKGTATMKAKLQEFFKLLQEADETALLSTFKLDPTPDDEGQFTVKGGQALTSPHVLPDTITSLGKFFFGCRPNSKGGMVWSQIRLLHSTPIDNLVEDLRDDLSDMSCGMTKQAIQHWDVTALGFLMNLHPEADGPVLEEFFNGKLLHYFPAGTHIVGLKVKTPFDGKKSQYDPNVKFKDRIRAFHVETIGSVKDVVLHKLKTILVGDDFASRYRCGVRLVPLFDRRSSPYTQDKIRKCIMQHHLWCQCVMSMPIEGIEFLDQPNRQLKGCTLRQLILALPDSHFISIDINWSRTHYCVLFPKKYEHQAQCRVAHLAAYLHKEHGDKILSSLSATQQKMVKETEWDEDGRPISKVEQELDDILDMGSTMDYVDVSFLEKSEATPAASSSFAPRASPVPMNFVPVADDSSVSTFGTAVFKSPGKSSTQPFLSSSSGSATVNSSVTMESRVSQVESTLGDMKAMLQQIVASTSGSPSLGKAGQQG